MRVEVEWATLESVDWFDNHRRFLEPIGNILPAKAEAEYLFLSRRPAMSVGLKPTSLRKTRSVSGLPE